MLVVFEKNNFGLFWILGQKKHPIVRARK